MTAPRLIYEWDEALVRKTLSALTIDRCRIFLRAADFSGILDEDESWKREPWYHTEYLEKRIDEDLAAQVRNPDIYFVRYRTDHYL